MRRHLQEEDAERANRKGYTRIARRCRSSRRPTPTARWLQLQPVGYDRPMPVAPGITAEFINAGHLLGSAYARVHDESSGKTILFGGDLGRFGRPVLPDPAPVEAADVLLVESTYGNRMHEPDDDGAHLASIVTRDDRTRREGDHSGVCARPCRGAAVLDRSSRATAPDSDRAGICRQPDGLRRARRIPEAADRARARSDLAGSRLGGRARRRTGALPVLHREAQGHHVDRESRAVQESADAVDRDFGQRDGHRRPRAASPRARAAGCAKHRVVRRLPGGRHARPSAEDGAKYARIHGQDVPVAARIEALESMSAHADANEILRWLRGFKQHRRSHVLVHGEPRPMDALGARIESELGWAIRAPGHGERVSCHEFPAAVSGPPRSYHRDVDWEL